MRFKNISWLASLLTIVALIVVGCGHSATEKPQSVKANSGSNPAESKYDVQVASAAAKLVSPAKEPESEPQPLANGEEKSLAAPIVAASVPLDDLPVGELTMPQVALTEVHSQSCRVKVGDRFPDLQLNDLAGAKRSLGELLGAKLTVVSFWNGRQPSALEELADLGSPLVQRFAGNGVAVVGVNTGDSGQLAGELASHAGARYVNLSDADGTAFGQVATEKLPRTYLLDSSGKIVWLDIEYSRSRVEI